MSYPAISLTTATAGRHRRPQKHPLSVITSMNKHGLVSPSLIEYYGNSDAASVDTPLPTVTAKARHGLANPTLIQVNHGNGPQDNPEVPDTSRKTDTPPQIKNERRCPRFSLPPP